MLTRFTALHYQLTVGPPIEMTAMLSFPLAEAFNIKMYLKHENVFQIHKIHAKCISITKYKLLLLS